MQSKFIGYDKKRIWFFLQYAAILDYCLIQGELRGMEIKDLLIYIYIWHFNYTNQLMLTARVLSLCLTDIYCYAPATIGRGGGAYCFTPVRSSHLVCIVYPANSSYSFWATALILCRMFIHIMEVCMSTGFWFSSNIW